MALPIVYDRSRLSSEKLPELPPIQIALVDERIDPDGFLALHRTRLSVQGSEPVPYDYVSRKALDSSVIVAYFREEGVGYVYLRSATRPPLALRGRESSMWELPAGLIEPGESPVAGARRELEEELGFRVEETALKRLGRATFPAPAVQGEEQHFFSVEVDPKKRSEPQGDGSPFEALSIIHVLSFDAVERELREGGFPDAKTEIGLRRLLERE